MKGNINSNSKANPNSIQKNNENKDKNSDVSPNGLTVTFKDDLPTNLYDRLVDYVKQQDKLDEFLKYDERQLRVFFLEEIRDIFQQTIRSTCNTDNVGKIGLNDFLADNWVKLRVDELVELIIRYVYNHSPLAVETKTRGLRQFKKLRQELCKDIIDNWFAIIGHECVTS